MAETTEYKGKYLRYEGAEYESAFIPCGVEGVWLLERGESLKNLVSLYSQHEKNKFGEIHVVLNLNVTPIDKKLYPNSHYTAFASVEGIIHSKSGTESGYCDEK